MMNYIKLHMKKYLFIALCLLLVQGVRAQKLVVPAIPGSIEKEGYAQYVPDVMNCIDWMKTHAPSEQGQKDASAFVLWWLSGSPDIRMELNSDVVKFENGSLLMILLGGWAQYAIQQKDNDQVKGCYAGLETALGYYEQYKDELGKDKGAEKLLKMRKKGTLKEFVEKGMKK